MNRSIKKAFDIVSYVVDHPRKMSLSEMSSEMRMNKTTLYRFLNTLESIGILSKKDEYYVPGIRLFELGNKVPVKQLLVDKIHPILALLSAEVNETVNMGELSGAQVLYLDKIESQRSLQIRSTVGDLISLHSSALGKSILSILPEPLRNTTIERIHFQKMTGNTITSSEILRKHVEITRQRGYSTDLGEMEEGLNCVAVPLLIKELDFYGGISCSGPAVRFTSDRLARFALELKETADIIKELFKKGE